MRWTPDKSTQVVPARVVEEGRIWVSDDSPFAKLELLWKERRFLIRVTVWGAFLSAVLSLLIPVRYEATARVMPPDSASGNSLAALLAQNTGSFAGLAGHFLEAQSNSDLLVGILSSNTLQDKLITRYDLKKVYGLSYQEDLRTRLSENTAIGMDRKNGIISLTFTDHDPKRAASIANSYIDELNRLTTELSTSSARREREFLERRLQQVSQDLEVAEKDLSQFSSKHATVNPQEQGKAMVDAAAELQGRLIETQAELEGLRVIYSDNNARVRSAKAQIARLQQEVKNMSGRAGPDTSPDDANQIYPSIRELPLLGVTFADLYRRTRIQETVYETLTGQYELAKVQEAKEIPSVKILDPAGIPQKKSFPPRTLITIIGTSFAFALGILWTLGAARWETVDPTNPGKILAQQVWQGIALPIRTRFARQNGWKKIRSVFTWLKRKKGNDC